MTKKTLGNYLQDLGKFWNFLIFENQTHDLKKIALVILLFCNRAISWQKKGRQKSNNYTATIARTQLFMLHCLYKHEDYWDVRCTDVFIVVTMTDRVKMWWKCLSEITGYHAVLCLMTNFIQFTVQVIIVNCNKPHDSSSQKVNTVVHIYLNDAEVSHHTANLAYIKPIQSTSINTVFLPSSVHYSVNTGNVQSLWIDICPCAKFGASLSIWS